MNTAAIFLMLGGLTTLAFGAQPISGTGAAPHADAPTTVTWSSEAAAQYLDKREAWWLKWPVSQRDHGTACVSCHTALPYALSRRTLRDSLHEQAPSPVERQMLEYVTKRVTLWSEVEPFYTDKQMGPNKTLESRGTESVLNALVLANYDAGTGSLGKSTKAALDEMWLQQLKTGPATGAWEWLQFHNAPWEGNESRFLGATMAALAVGLAPANYSATPDIQEQLRRLTDYLHGHYKEQPLLNRTFLLLASARLPQLLTAEEKASLTDEIFSKQRPDGGWNLASLGSWEERHDHTPFDTHSDGYATGLTVLALEQTGVARTQTSVAKGLDWLKQNQDPAQGLWRSWSLNKERDWNSDIGRFMSDAATAYAVMALQDAF